MEGLFILKIKVLFNSEFLIDKITLLPHKYFNATLMIDNIS